MQTKVEKSKALGQGEARQVKEIRRGTADCPVLAFVLQSVGVYFVFICAFVGLSLHFRPESVCVCVCVCVCVGACVCEIPRVSVI